MSAPEMPELPENVTPIRPGKPLPVNDKPLVPYWRLTWWRLIALVTWPAQARQLKRGGFVRTGWRKWEWPGPA